MSGNNQQQADYANLFATNNNQAPGKQGFINDQNFPTLGGASGPDAQNVTGVQFTQQQQ